MKGWGGRIGWTVNGKPQRIGFERGLNRWLDPSGLFIPMCAPMFMSGREFVASEDYANVRARLEEMYASGASWLPRDQVYVPVELCGNGKCACEFVDAFYQLTV